MGAGNFSFSRLQTPLDDRPPLKDPVNFFPSCWLKRSAMNNKPSEKFTVLSGMFKPVNWLPFLVMWGIFLLYFFPLIFEDNTLVYRDIAHFAYPMKWYIWKVWKLGEWPLWYPNIFHGTPFLQLMHPGVFYPPSVFFLLKDFVLAFNSWRIQL